MSGQSEAAFRVLERQLDQIVEHNRHAFIHHGIQITDNSAREYHYKNDRLAWEHRFEKRRSRPPEIEAAIVILSVDEPADDEASLQVAITLKAEIFQIGKESRWERIDKTSVAPASLVDGDLAATICSWIDQELSAMQAVP